MNSQLHVTWLTLLNLLQFSESCSRVDQYCNCDDKCQWYNDCCPDYSMINRNTIATGTFTCKSIFRSEKVWIVDQCSDRKHPYANLCSSIRRNRSVSLQSLIPVWTDDRVTYDNQFCAWCNTKTRFKYHSVKVQCRGIKPQNTRDKMNFFNNPRFCTINSILTTQMRLCDDKLIRACPNYYNKKSMISNSCERGSFSPVEHGYLTYRNDACCKCWNVSCNRSNYLRPRLYSINRDEFTYLLNFNEWEQPLTVSVISTISNITNTTSFKSIIGNYVFYSSFILTLLSILSVVCLIYIYVKNYIFHNFGGYLTICLSLCLLSMNVLSLIMANRPITHHGLCTFVSILQHYVALSNFIWMAIYGLDLLQTFGTGATNRNKVKTFTTFLKYCVIGFGLSTMVVGAATISEYSFNGNSSIRPQYGGRKCWFTSMYGGIIWYFAPVSLLVLWNCAACAVVIFKLSKTAKECQMVRGKDSNKTLWLCVRLTSVFGIGYFVQIIAVLSDVNGLIVAGSLINCAQGCLLAACFLLTKKVRNILSIQLSSMTNLTYNKSSSTARTLSTDLGPRLNVLTSRQQVQSLNTKETKPIN